MKRLVLASLVLALGVAAVGTATAVVGGNDDSLNPAAVEPKTAAVDELVDDPEAGKPPTYAPRGTDDGPPSYVPGLAEVVPPDTPAGRKLNPTNDPNVRACRNPDGTYVVIHTTPVPGKDPYPNDPEDLRRRPC